MASGIVVNRQAVEKLQSFYNDPAYRDAIENSASYNTRMMFEKKMRLPFLDAQTGVAQNHCNLWMLPRHRMPGEEPGQIYTYPAKRWRKRRRQYLTTFLQPRKKEGVDGESEVGVAEVFTAIRETGNEDSKDSMPIGTKDEASKETWYYDELDIQDTADFEEHDGDSDVDYEESFNKKKKKKAVPPKTPKSTRGRKKQIPVNYDASVDAEKPYSCETCGARYKTRPGLTYHYTHSHKNLLEDDDDEPAPVPSTPKTSRDQSSGSNSGVDTPVRSRSTRQAAQAAVVNSPSAPSPMAMQHTPPPPPPVVESHAIRRANVAPTPQQHPQQPPALVPQQPLPVPVHPVAAPSSSGMVVNQEMEEKARAMPSPYCDFCLGDASENKKTGCSEELVSCSDCGRSGHPSCLQFTPNMIISVKKYRWQCIECKCCSLCGNSDNDEQLLFCDDCDRGYHMYCLKPPLSEPPEGSWSCHLCQVVFHRK